MTGDAGPASCEVKTATGSYDMDPDQAASAATISAVAASRRLPLRAVTIALATAMQESELRNIEHGDRDSLGLFQQRPSQGWGTTKQIQDPVYSSGRFYDHLVKIPGYSRLPLTVAAQRVQRSGFPQAYAKHETSATLLAAAFTGRERAALNCTTGDGEKAAPATPDQVRAQLAREFGKDLVPDQEPAAAATSGDPEADATVTVATGANSAESGWQLAHWAVAHATILRLEKVTYAGRTWTASGADDGWQKKGNSGADRVRLVTTH
ncbi:hypothetical protein [Streptomyces boninensis]|uniref:hypothetical protein n=1 Tax=Streptomyces boninensis TaxID=2039455 RepID=UPI003B226713